MAEIERMLADCRRLRIENHNHRAPPTPEHPSGYPDRQIEAAACAIREKAILDCLEALKK